ncbi:MAG: bifunctional nuclease family protein [Nitrosopumilus sp.]|nr:bifunctional nuclease family protein [Nitrosopumilus sp.]
MPDNLFSEDNPDYVEVRINNIGFLDTMGLEGAIVLKSLDGIEFPIVAFSGEVAQHIALFNQGKKNDIPTIYNLVEEIAAMHDLLLLEVRIYQSESILRANLYFQNRKKEILILRNYRASDAIALAAYYDIPIKLRKTLLEKNNNKISGI